MQKLVIKGRLPNLNDILKNSTTHWAVAFRKKKESMELVEWYVRQQKIKPVGKAQITITCYEPNLKRDEDNVLAGACKIILDALQRAKIIEGDGRKYIELVTNPVKIDRANPRIEVKIEEVK